MLRLRTFRNAAAAAVVSAGILLALPAIAQTASKPNVVIILAYKVGYDDLGKSPTSSSSWLTRSVIGTSAPITAARWVTTRPTSIVSPMMTDYYGQQSCTA